MWGFRFRVPGFNFRGKGFAYPTKFIEASGLGLGSAGDRLRVSGFEFRVPGFGFRVPNFGFQISGFGFRVPGFGFQVSGTMCDGVPASNPPPGVPTMLLSRQVIRQNFISLRISFRRTFDKPSSLPKPGLAPSARQERGCQMSKNNLLTPSPVLNPTGVPHL